MKTSIPLLIIFALAGKVIFDYMDLPIAGINQAGICKYLIIDGKKTMPCAQMPNKYVKESIKGWK